MSSWPLPKAWLCLCVNEKTCREHFVDICNIFLRKKVFAHRRCWYCLVYWLFAEKKKCNDIAPPKCFWCKKCVFTFSRVEYAGGMLVYILPVFVTFVKFQKVILQDGKKHCYKWKEFYLIRELNELLSVIYENVPFNVCKKKNCNKWVI